MVRLPQEAEIHLVGADEKPQLSEMVEVVCGQIFPFREPIEVRYFEDGRVCLECVNHRGGTGKKRLFAFFGYQEES